MPTTRCTSPKPANSPVRESPSLLEVTGAAHYLPAYAGNLDIMTSAALATAERIAGTRQRSSRSDSTLRTSVHQRRHAA